MAEPIISVSGLRGVIGESLTPDLAVRYVAAFAATLPPGPVIVSRDGRTTGSMLAAAVQSALAASGKDVWDAGVASTPTLGVLVRHYGAVGGVQISASHNPLPYNGLKLFNHEGRVIPAVAGKKVLDGYRAASFAWAPHDKIGTIRPLSDTTGPHLKLLLETVDVAAIKARGCKVLLDSNAGAGSLLGKTLLQNLGCQVTILGGDPTGRFIHPPEPTAENLKSVQEKVVAAGADIGFCQDPDADRLAVIDEQGRYIGEEYTVALCLDHVLRQKTGPVVTNCSTSRMSQDLAEKYQAPFSRSAVGEANVVDEMKRVGAVFGGEGNGGPIDPRIVYVRDSFVGMAQILAAITSRGKKISELVAELPRYHIHKTTTPLAAEKLPAAYAALQKHFAEATADRLDGLRLDWPDRWLIIRGSNTEPIVRIIAEAPTADAAAKLCTDANAILQKV
ncbi:phosphoglucosamine mutase [Anatilimnocola floriformis]|uniref:phosphoglucosamine mutase n=1 Tax=Anatilimnocola floriformis TaxID=2948575 RepID=UPI0020C377A7|nr:phosphoglucosamine mutase [Anatilimnocola floriformis]